MFVFQSGAQKTRGIQGVANAAEELANRLNAKNDSLLKVQLDKLKLSPKPSLSDLEKFLDPMSSGTENKRGDIFGARNLAALLLDLPNWKEKAIAVKSALGFINTRFAKVPEPTDVGLLDKGWGGDQGLHAVGVAIGWSKPLIDSTESVKKIALEASTVNEFSEMLRDAFDPRIRSVGKPRKLK